MKVMHIITALNYGGAEAMLGKLIAQHDAHPGLPRSTVVSLMPLGRVGQQMRASGVQVDSLHLERTRQLPRALAQLMSIVRRQSPDLIQGWMYHGNIAASAAAKCVSRRVPLLWNIRHSLSDLSVEKRSSRRVIQFGAFLSNGPFATIYNSATAVRQHSARGYDPQNAIVIPNGFDHQHFRPDAPDRSSRRLLRENFGIDANATLVAVVARHHPMKDHATAIEAVGRARALGHDVHLLLAGSGTDTLPEKLLDICAQWLPPDRLTMLGDRRDVADWLPGCDIVALSSAWGEGFPNILGEAMASGVPCIATDVGDSRTIIDNGGICVPCADPVAMAEAIASLGAMGAGGRQLIGSRGRSRIQTEFSLPVIARRYADLYETAVHAVRAGKRNEPGIAKCAG